MDQPITRSSSPYDTEEKRRKHAERQRKWRKANPDKARLIAKKSWQRMHADPIRSAKRKKRLKESWKKKEVRALHYVQQMRRFQKTQDAVNSHRRWTEDDIATAFDRNLTDPQIAELLGRSVKAVSEARRRHMGKAPAGWGPKA